MLAHFGEKDDAKGFSDPETAKKLEDAAKAGGVNFTLKMWEGAGHAFMNRANPKTFMPEISAQAMKMTVDFLKQHLA